MAEVGRDYSVEAEGPRDICANLAMTFRERAVEAEELAKAQPLNAVLYRLFISSFTEWATRLERACAKLDEDRQLAAQYREDYDNCCRGQADLRVRVAAAEAASQRLTEAHEGFFTAASLEAAVAMAKWPNEEIYHRLAALSGEVGELAEGVIKNRPDVEQEAIQVAACAYRCWKTLRLSAAQAFRRPGEETP